MPRAMDAVELPGRAELTVDASGRAVRADPARAKVKTHGIEAKPIRGMIQESAKIQRSTGLVGPKRIRNHLGAISRLLLTRRERLLYEGISMGRRDHSSW